MELIASELTDLVLSSLRNYKLVLKENISVSDEEELRTFVRPQNRYNFSKAARARNTVHRNPILHQLGKTIALPTVFCRYTFQDKEKNYNW